ncbi:hypothetical protein CKO41_07805 [Thiococcus pfennigii]|nr:hypothetical protein [Thiococcus pfennigii]
MGATRPSSRPSTVVQRARASPPRPRRPPPRRRPSMRRVSTAAVRWAPAEARAADGRGDEPPTRAGGAMTEAKERVDRSGVDIVLLKTFLEVARSRHFGKTADRLFITQSAVSARIKLLESTLGAVLFTRRRHDIQLTPAGRRLLPHAETIVRSWSRARAEATLDARFTVTVTVATEADLWPLLVGPWGRALRARRPDLVLDIEALPARTAFAELTAGRLDLAFVREPPRVAELACEPLAPIELILVATRPGLPAEAAIGEGYLQVAWGRRFEAAHRRHFPECATPVWRLSAGLMALDLLQAQDGAAYLPAALAAAGLGRGTLHRVADAPPLACEPYAVWNSQLADPALIAEIQPLPPAVTGPA